MLYDDAFITRTTEHLRALAPAWDLSAKADISLLTVSENATFRLREPGRDLVVRVHRPDYHTETEILSELAWIAALRREQIVTTPEPIPTREGTPLLRFLDGDTPRHAVAFAHMSGLEPDAGSDLIHWYATLGEITARLHQHSRGWTRPPWFTRKTWTYDRILGTGAYWGDWRHALGLTPEGRVLLGRAAARLKAETTAFGTHPDRFGLIHCDPRAANLLIDGDRLGVIDFDDCGLCWFGYDFASSVSFIEHAPYVPDLMAAWLRGYRRIAPFPPEQEAALPMLIMLRRMQLTAWIASHAETPTALALGSGFTEGTFALADHYLGTKPL